MKRFARIVAVVTIVLNAQGYASADLFEYDTQSAFTAAATVLTTDSFDGCVVTGGYADYFQTPLVRPNFTVTNASDIYCVTSGFGPNNQMPNGGTCVVGAGSYETDVTLASPCTAVGFDIFSLNSAGTVTGSVTLSDHTTHAITYAAVVPSTTPPTYVGFVETTPGLTITQFSTSADAGFAFSNVSLGNATPEPTSSVLLATGLLGLLCYAWRKRR